MALNPVSSASSGVRPVESYHAPSSSFLSKITTLALGIFAIYAVASLPGAAAGLTEYHECVADCLGTGGPPLMCALICTPTIFF